MQAKLITFREVTDRAAQVKNPYPNGLKPRNEDSGPTPSYHITDLKKKYPGILEYCRRHDLSFTEARGDYDRGQSKDKQKRLAKN